MGVQIRYAEEDVRLGEEEIGVLEISGDIDILTVDELNQDFEEVLRKGRRHFVLSMSGVRSIKSTGIGAILGFAKRVDAMGGTVRVCELSDNIAQVFDLLSIGEILTICETGSEARAGLRHLAASQAEKIRRLHVKIETLQIELEKSGDAAAESGDPITLFSRFLASVKQRMRTMGETNRRLQQENRRLQDRLNEADRNVRAMQGK